MLKSHLPPVVPHFTGRDKECADIFDHLTVRDTKFVNAWGSPGFGKTSVATAVGHQLNSQGLPVLLLSLRGVKTVNEMARQMLNVSQQTKQGSFDQTPQFCNGFLQSPALSSCSSTMQMICWTPRRKSFYNFFKTLSSLARQ